jgi:hypothetical protein
MEMARKIADGQPMGMVFKSVGQRLHRRMHPANHIAVGALAFASR